MYYSSLPGYPLLGVGETPSSPPQVPGANWAAAAAVLAVAVGIVYFTIRMPGRTPAMAENRRQDRRRRLRGRRRLSKRLSRLESAAYEEPTESFWAPDAYARGVGHSTRGRS